MKTACQTLTFLAHPEVKALVEVHEVAGQRSSADRQVHRLRLYYLHTASTQRYHSGTGTTLSQSQRSHRHDTLTVTTLPQARHSHRHNTHSHRHNTLSQNTLCLTQSQHSHRHNTLAVTTLSQSQHSHKHNTFTGTTLSQNTLTGTTLSQCHSHNALSLTTLTVTCETQSRGKDRQAMKLTFTFNLLTMRYRI